ncbi:MAG: N-acetyl-gamma-glutamyl-phosphate reductase [Spirochaetaceae bacterium]|nr:MAG: N-acetyl-gamma-glutamyl-phosphate reductase [Spirochaetaceae bacterium]
MKATILGATGYTGMMLLRILASHPEVKCLVASSRGAAGRPLAEADPGLSPAALASGRLSPVVLSPAEALEDPGDVLFSALPHGASAETCAPVLGRTVVIDLSADFRFRDAGRYRSAYGADPPQARFQEKAVYGLCERYRESIRHASLIANPGCYPTATLLPLLPLLPHLLPGAPIVVNALSGITGAGKKEVINLLYAERTENANAYNPGRRHRHAAEIAEQLGGETLLFTPHLVPLKQGMLVTTTVTVRDASTAVDALDSACSGEPFLVLTGETPPETRHVRGTNQVRIGREVVAKGGYGGEDILILMSAIDNLWKGAAGQAVQNMNIRFGFDETAGLLREADL